MRTTTRGSIVLLLASLILCPGCDSSGLVKGKGRVTLDGAPVEGAVVTFFPLGPDAAIANAKTDTAGHFALATRDHLGMRPGRYKAVVTKQEAPPAAIEKSKPGFPGKTKMTYLAKSENLLPPIYSDLNKTPLSFEVPPGGSDTLELPLTSKQGN